MCWMKLYKYLHFKQVMEPWFGSLMEPIFSPFDSVFFLDSMDAFPGLGPGVRRSASYEMLRGLAGFCLLFSLVCPCISGNSFWLAQFLLGSSFYLLWRLWAPATELSHRWLHTSARLNLWGLSLFSLCSENTGLLKQIPRMVLLILIVYFSTWSLGRGIFKV